MNAKAEKKAEKKKAKELRKELAAEKSAALEAAKKAMEGGQGSDPSALTSLGSLDTSSLPPHPDLVPPTPSSEGKIVSEPTQSDASKKPVVPDRNNESEDLPLKTLKKTGGSLQKKPPKEKSEAKKDASSKVKKDKRSAESGESDSPSPVKKAKKSKVVSDQEVSSGEDKKSVATSDKVAEEVTKDSDAFANSFNNVQPISGSPVINSQQSTTGIVTNTILCLFFKKTHLFVPWAA